MIDRREVTTDPNSTHDAHVRNDKRILLDDKRATDSQGFATNAVATSFSARPCSALDCGKGVYPKSIYTYKQSLYF